MRRRHLGKRAYAALAAALAVAAGLAIALSIGGGSAGTSSADASPHYDIHSDAPAIKPVGSVDPAIAKQVAAFRRPATAADRLDPSLLGPDEHDHGANPQLARLIGRTPLGAKEYMVPVGGGICLVGTDYLVDDCYAPDEINGGGGPAAIICAPYMPADDLVLSEVLPDGVSNVTLKRKDGSTVNVAVHNNFFMYVQKKSEPIPLTASWDAPDGHHTLKRNLFPKIASSTHCAQTNPQKAVAQMQSILPTLTGSAVRQDAHPAQQAR